MTTEQDFHDMLDSNIEDYFTREVLADWLQDQNDRRADGYRELARLRIYPNYHKLPTSKNSLIRRTILIEVPTALWTWKYPTYWDKGEDDRYCIPYKLWELLSGYTLKSTNKAYFNTRKDAENSFAAAFAIYKKPLPIKPFTIAQDCVRDENNQ